MDIDNLIFAFFFARLIRVDYSFDSIQPNQLALGENQRPIKSLHQSLRTSYYRVRITEFELNF